MFVWEADFNYEVGSIRNIHINGNWYWIEPDNKIIKTLWDRLEVPPISPYADYFNPNSE